MGSFRSTACAERFYGAERLCFGKRLIFLGSLTALIFLVIITSYARHMLFKGPDEDTPPHLP